MDVCKVFLALFCIVLKCQAIQVTQEVPGCWDGWVKHGKSCYLFARQFSGNTFAAASQVCQLYNAYLQESNSLEEHGWLLGQVGNMTWKDMPWLGLIRPFGDGRWVLPTLKMRSGDEGLNKVIDGLVAVNQGNSGLPLCGGMTGPSKKLGFWECTLPGSSICEIDLRETPTNICHA